MLQALPALEGALAGNGAFLASLVGVLCPLLPLLRGIVGRREYVATEWDARAALIGVPAALTLAGWCASGTGYLAAVAACYKALCVAILPACCRVSTGGAPWFRCTPPATGTIAANRCGSDCAS